MRDLLSTITKVLQTAFQKRMTIQGATARKGSDEFAVVPGDSITETQFVVGREVRHSVFLELHLHIGSDRAAAIHRALSLESDAISAVSALACPSVYVVDIQREEVEGRRVHTIELSSMEIVEECAS